MAGEVLYDRKMGLNIEPELFAKLARFSKIHADWFTVCRYRVGFGGTPKYVHPNTVEEFFEALEIISCFFDACGNMTSDWDWSKAEAYALALAHEKKNEAACYLFSQILAGKACNEVLWTNRKNALLPSTEIAMEKGLLGYEGVFVYAQLLIKRRQRKFPKALLSTIVANIPTRCLPSRLQEIRIESIELLLRLKQTKVGDIDLADELARAKAHQH